MMTGFTIALCSVNLRTTIFLADQVFFTSFAVLPFGMNNTSKVNSVSAEGFLGVEDVMYV